MTVERESGIFRRALLAVSDDNLGERLRRCLSERAEVAAVAPGDALAASGETDALVFANLSDAESIYGAAGRDASARNRPIVFLTDDSPPSNYFPIVERYGIRCFLHPQYLECDRMLGFGLAHLLGGSAAIGLRASFGDCALARSRTIDSTTGRREVIGEIGAEVETVFEPNYRSTERRLALEEIVNNALFHAFTNDGVPRYTPQTAEDLREGDSVTVEYVVDESVFAFSVADSAGTLSGDTSRRHIARQLSGEGQFDVRGRGMFLTFTLANAFVLNSVPGERAEIAVAFSRPHPPAYKLFLTRSG
jgi:hypothetical protein